MGWRISLVLAAVSVEPAGGREVPEYFSDFNLVSAAVLAWLIDKSDMEGFGPAVLLASLVWLGFVAAILGPMYAFQAYSPSFFLITSGGVLAGMLAMGGILGIWR